MTQVIKRSHEMDEKAWWDLWNSSYRIETKDEVSEKLFVRAAQVINETIRTTGGRMLEIACGTGLLSRRLAFSVYHGLDISPAAIEVAAQATSAVPWPADVQVPTYQAADFHAWAIPSEPYDVVACVDAISCFREPESVLKKMTHCLRSEGRLILTTINPFVYHRIRRHWESGPFSKWFKRQEIHELVESAGLVIEQSRTIMPRGRLGILWLLNANHINRAFGPRSAAWLERTKERVGLGQYRLIVARKPSKR